VVLGSDTTQNFISSDPQQRRRVIEELLGLGRFDAYLTRVKEERKGNALKMEDVKAKLSFLSGRGSSTATRVSAASAEIASCETRLAATRKQLEHAEKELLAAQAAAEDARKKREEELRRLKQEHEKLSLQESLAKKARRYHALSREHRSRLDQLSAQRKQLQAEAARLEAQLESLAKARKLSSLEEAAKASLSQQQPLESLLSSLVTPLPPRPCPPDFRCPTCDSLLDPDTARRVFDTIEERNAAIEKHRAAVAAQTRALGQQVASRQAEEKRKQQQEAAHASAAEAELKRDNSFL